MRKGTEGQVLCPLSRSRATALGVELEQYSPGAAAPAPPQSGTPQKAMRSLFRVRTGRTWESPKQLNGSRPFITDFCAAAFGVKPVISSQ